MGDTGSEVQGLLADEGEGVPPARYSSADAGAEAFDVESLQPKFQAKLILQRQPSSEGEGLCQEWLGRARRGEFDTVASSLTCVCLDEVPCALFSIPLLPVSPDLADEMCDDATNQQPDVLGVGVDNTECLGHIMYRIRMAAPDQEQTPRNFVHVMQYTGFSQAALRAALIKFESVRAARLSTAAPGNSPEGSTATAKAPHMAPPAAGNQTSGRNSVVAALCCLVSPVAEFASEFVQAGVWQPIRDLCKRASKPATETQIKQVPGEAGVLDLQVAAPAMETVGCQKTTIVVLCNSLEAMSSFELLWSSILTDTAAAAQGGTIPSLTDTRGGPVVLPVRPPVDNFNEAYVGGIRAWTKYATPAETIFILLGCCGLAFNAGAISQVASIISRLLVFVLSADYDNARETSWEILLWGSIFAVTQFVSYFILERMAEVLSARFRRHYFKAMLRQDQEWFDTQSQSLSVDLTQDVNMVRDGIGRMLGTYINMQLMFPIALVRAFIRGPKLAAIMCIGVPFMWKAGKMTLEAYMKAFITSKAAYAQAAAYVEEILSNLPTLTSIGGERRAQVTYAKKNAGVFKTLKDSAWKDSKGLSFLFGIMYVMTGVGTFAAARLIVNEPESYDAGVVAEVSTNITWGAMMLGMVTVIAMPYKLAVGAARKMLGIIQRVPDIDAYSHEGVIPSPTLSGSIELRNVRFSYPSLRGTEVLKGVSFKIPPSSLTAFVGGSGCGKSTVVRLLQRLYDPVEGTILLDGVPMRSMNITKLRKLLGVVSQEPLLFNCSIEDNIRLGAEQGTSPTQADIDEACRVANALDFINNDLNDGFRTLVGRGGSKLSGGQKQRIAIARAFIRRPRLLLLDEATSALDEKSQEIVQKNIESKMQELDGTTVMIAHRQTTYMNASCIICFANGVVVESAVSEPSAVKGSSSGSAHQKLMSAQGEYYALFTGKSNNNSDLLKATTTASKSTELTIDASDTNMELDVTTSSEEQSMRQSIAFQMTEQKAEQSKSVLPSKGCCSSACRIVSLLGSRELQREDYRWVIPCLVIFAALYGLSIPGLLIVQAENFVNLGSCLPVLNVNETLQSLTNYDLDKCHDDMLDESNLFVIFYISFAVIAMLVSYLKNVTLQLSIACVTRALRDAVFVNVIRQEMAFFDQAENSPFAISSRLADDTELVAKAYGQPIAAVADFLCAVTIAYSVALIASWRVVVVTIGILPVMAYFSRKQHGLKESSQRRAQKLMADASTVAGDAGHDIATVAVFNMQQSVQVLYESLVDERVGEGIQYALGVALMFMISETGRYINQFIVYLYGSFLAAAGHMTGPDIILCDNSIMSATFSTTGAVSQLPDIAKAASAQGLIFSIMDRKSKIDALNSLGGNNVTTPSPSKSDGSNYSFQLSDVSFSYPSATNSIALLKVSFEIRGGESTALIGGSGCGKSTLIRLLQRLYDPCLGSISLDGKDLRSIDPAWLRQQLAVVGQEPVLYNATIMENVKYGGPLDPITGDPIATDDEAIAACKRANAHNFIEELPQGYQTQVRRSGGSLSGGQKQRIAIARAIIREPSVFLLDEATSALDSQSEAAVQQSLDRESAGKTVVVIAHRLTTTKACDNIFVFDQGLVREEAHRRGGVSPHTQLIADCDQFPLGLYRQLWSRWQSMGM